MREDLKARWDSSNSLMGGKNDLTMVTFSDYPVNKSSVYVVIPCYNEKQNLPRLMNDISLVLSKIMPFEIIVVNDGSSDDSDIVLTNLAIKFPIRLLHHKQNMGLSSALKDGLLFAITIARSNDIVITMDADNTHNSTYLRKMIETVHQGADIVIASRYVVGGLQIGVSNNRIMLSKWVNYILNLLSGQKIKDLTSGYRCYRASILKKGLEKYNSHFIDAKGFEVQTELLLKLSSISRNIHEIPFKLRYDEKQGKSKMPLFETIKNYVLLSPKILVWRRQKK